MYFIVATYIMKLTKDLFSESYKLRHYILLYFINYELLYFSIKFCQMTKEDNIKLP